MENSQKPFDFTFTYGDEIYNAKGIKLENENSIICLVEIFDSYFGDLYGKRHKFINHGGNYEGGAGRSQEEAEFFHQIGVALTMYDLFN